MNPEVVIPLFGHYVLFASKLSLSRTSPVLFPIICILFTDIKSRPVFTLFPQLLSYSSSGPPKSSSWSTARGSVCFLLCCWLVIVLCFLSFSHREVSVSCLCDRWKVNPPSNLTTSSLFPICIFSTGLEGLVGRRCLLASPVLHHPAGHHGAAAAFCEQPEVRVQPEPKTHFRQFKLTVFNLCFFWFCFLSGSPILLWLMKMMTRKRPRSQCWVKLLVRPIIASPAMASLIVAHHQYSSVRRCS